VDRTEKRYAVDRAAYEDDLKKALTGLETEPDWTKLLDEDREEIAARLSGQGAAGSGQNEEPAEIIRRYRRPLDRAADPAGFDRRAESGNQSETPGGR